VVLLVGDHPGKVHLERVVALASEQGVPVLLDAAGSVPPKENLWKFTRDGGADAVIVSGGKGLGGPQSTGLVLGRQAIIDGCAYHGVPNCRIGRGMKVGKEELAGIYAAAKLFMMQDEAEIHAARMRQADYIAACTSDLPGISVRRVGPTRVDFLFDAAAVGMSYGEAYEWFLRTEPSVLLGHSNNGLGLNTAPLKEGDERIIAEKLRQFFVGTRRERR
jgi:seryl-tRNA(Sec) selenium transferase